MAGHALGMGLKSANGPVQTITRSDGWDALGYDVTGDFREIGEEATIRRPSEHSPHPLHNVPEAKPFVQAESFPTKMAELQWVGEQIDQDIDAGLHPEQILVIVIGDRHRDIGHALLRQELEQHDHDVNCVWCGDPKVFATDGAVTVSGIHRAKGNEAASVYLVGLENIHDTEYRESAVHRRNEAFVGITRSRTWCTITGVDEKNVTILGEAKQVAAAVSRPDPEITFPIPDPKKLDHELEDKPSMETTELFDFAD